MKKLRRWMAMCLCQTIGGMSLQQMAQIFNVAHIRGVSHQISQRRQ